MYVHFDISTVGVSVSVSVLWSLQVQTSYYHNAFYWPTRLL